MNAILFGEEYAEHYNIKGKYDTVPEVVQRLAKRDINIVVVSREILKDYNDFEIEILRGTFARYGARLETIEY